MTNSIWPIIDAATSVLFLIYAFSLAFGFDLPEPSVLLYVMVARLTMQSAIEGRKS